ncbi:MAG: tetratricopeptide repeat protein [Planctomycetota bacterium]
MKHKKRKHTQPKGPTGRQPPATESTPIYRVLPFILLFFLAAIAYLNADHEDFIFDSRLPLVENPEDVVNVETIIKRFYRGEYNPDARFTFLTFALNYAFNQAMGLDGFDITTFLIFNVIVHATNACLLYLLVRSLLGYLYPDRPRAVFIPLALAVLFAVHPIHASSVAYIMQRRGSLATMFYLLAILTFLKIRYYNQHKPVTDKITDSWILAPWPWKRIALAPILLALYWLSFRSKNLGITLPFAILAIEFCLRAPDRRAVKRYIAVLIPAAIAGTIAMFAFLWMRDLFDPATMTIKPFGPDIPWGIWEHFITESRVFIHYWKLLLLPLPTWSCIDHGFTLSTNLLHHGAILAIIFHTLLLVLAVMAAVKRYTLAGIGIFWFYVALIPYAFLPQRELYVEYKTYLPSIGLALIIAELLSRIRNRITINRQAVIVAVVAGLLLFTTVYRNYIYHDRYNAWGDAVKKSPNHARPHVNFGNALVRRKKLDEAMAHYQQALQIRPYYPEAHNHYGNILVLKGKNKQAIKHYKIALEVRPDYCDAFKNYAVALGNLGLLPQACEKVSKIIEIRPDYPQAHRFLGDLLRDRGMFKEAMDEYRKELEYYPKDKKARRNLNKLSAKLGNKQP